MPKGEKKKGKSDRGRLKAGSTQTSDEDSYNNDAASIASNFSSNRSLAETDENEEEDYDPFLDKLVELIDGLNGKSSQGRIKCFQLLTKILVKQYVPSYVRERHYTLVDFIERSLKKGGNAEKAAAADLATVICIQIGTEEESSGICKVLRPLLLTNAIDNSVAPAVRGKCCLALSNIAFTSGGEMAEVLSLMQTFESIFSGSYLKGDHTVPNITAENATLHADALNAWTLLFTLMASGDIQHMMNNSKTLPSLEKLSELLESPHLEVRLTAGEALALIFELGREETEDFEDKFAEDISATMKQLATDSHKYRAKKERKQQRATFRDILQFIKENTSSEIQVKFGKEVLVLDTWCRRKQYDSLSSILGEGTNTHLTENELLRIIFNLPALVHTNEDEPHAKTQMEKQQKKKQNAANFKTRTVIRAKHRDKRSDFI